MLYFVEIVGVRDFLCRIQSCDTTLELVFWSYDQKFAASGAEKSQNETFSMKTFQRSSNFGRSVCVKKKHSKSPSTQETNVSLTFS